MNYAKVVDAALRLFPKKIKVTFIHAGTGNTIVSLKMNPENLPQHFNKPVTIEANGSHWQVIKAEPARSDDYTFSKKLTVHVLQRGAPEIPVDRFLLPTSPAKQPEISTVGLYNDFVMDIREQDWRQIEFLPASLLPVIQEEMKAIEPILSTDNGENLLLGFTTRYIRDKTGEHNLNIPFTEFCQLVNVLEKGSVHIENSGYIQQSFALKTTNYMYYGIIHGNSIKDLGLLAFDCADDEFFSVVSKYNLVLADWCNPKIMMGEDTDRTENEKEIDI